MKQKMVQKGGLYKFYDMIEKGKLGFFSNFFGIDKNL